MDALRAAGLCALLAVSAQTARPCGPVAKISSPHIDRWQPFIEAASNRFGIPPDWIRIVMARESAGLRTLHGAPIVSSAGAMGLMQLMPGAWSDMRIRCRLGNDPFDPHDNIFAGTAYLREMFDRYGYPNLFAAYHAGPGRMDAVLKGKKPLPATTRIYLQSIVPGAELGTIASENRVSTTLEPAPDSLFFVRAGNRTSSSNRSGSSVEVPSLFVPLSAQPVSPRR